MKKLIKKLLILTVAVAMVVTAMPLTGLDLGEIFTLDAEAELFKNEDHKVYGDYIYTITEATSSKEAHINLIKYTGSEKNVVVPETIEELKVKTIGAQCFSYNGSTTSEHRNDEKYIPANPALKEIETVVLPETITRINSEAFAMCEKLTSVNIPESITHLGSDIFYECKSLKEITIPGKDISYQWSTFYRSYIEKINFCEGITEIPNEFFDCLTKVTSVTFPSSVTIIGEEAFTYSRVKTIIINGTLSNGAYEPYEFMDPSLSKSVESVYFKHSPTNLYLIDKYDVSYDEEIGYWHFKVIPQSTPTIYSDQSFEYYINENGEAVLTKYTGTNTYIKVPEYVGFVGINYGLVTEIGSGTFTDTAVTRVDLPNTVKRIGNKAFYKCEALETLNIPNSLEKIGNHAFYACKSLKNITLPDSLKSIGISAFKECTSLKLTSFPKSIKHIPSDAFFNCRSLDDYSIFKNIEIIAGGAFRGCTSLTIDDFGNTIKEIGECAFTGVTSSGQGGTAVITATKLPDSLEYIGNCAFAFCSTLTEMTIPGNIDHFGFGIFRGSSLEKAILSAPLKEMGEGMFEETLLKSVVLPEGLEKIADNAFYRTPLEEITLPDTLTYIGESAFEGCDKLKSVNIPPLMTDISRETFAGCWEIENIFIPPLVTKIGDKAFEECIKIESIVIPSTVKIIGKAAFDCCEKLTDITIENGVEEIGDSAFSWCFAKEITIPESVTKLGKEIIEESTIETVYYNAVNVTTKNSSLDKTPIFDSPFLKKIVFGDKVESVPYKISYKSNTLEEIVFSESIEGVSAFAFAECKGLKKIKFPNNLKRINGNAFLNCTNLSEIVMSENIEYIGSNSFKGCTSLTEITLPENLKEFYCSAFDGCSGIKTVNFNALNCTFKSLTKIEGYGAYYSPFVGLKSLETINISENIKELPAYLYCGIKTIDEIVLPSTVTDVGVFAFAFSSITSLKASDNLESIEEYAFYGCNNFEFADLGNNIMLLGAGAFNGCEKLTEIYIPDTVTNIETDAFKNCSALQTVRMSPNVDYIPREAFYNCAELSEFIWEAESKLVGRLAFGNCIKLTDFDFLNVEKLYINSFLGSGVAFVQLGESVNEESPSPLTTVEMQSFMDCKNLATLAIGGDVTTIKTQAFADCTNLETAVISDSVTEIAEDAFDGCDKLTIYCTENSYAYAYAQTQSINVSTLKIAPIPNQTYTGNEIKPSISVSYSDESLDKTDYTVSYSNNINVGTAKVSVTGTGVFKYLTSKAGFEIVSRKISDTVIPEISDREYTGKAITPEINVVYNGITLKKGVDYTVSYSDNTELGTATVTVKGIGNFKGEAKASFEIVEKGGQSSDNPPDTDPPADNDKSTFDRIIEFLTNSASAIINAFRFILGLFGF